MKTCEDESRMHLAAVMLLVTVIADLQRGDYFATLFKRNAQAVMNADSAVTTLGEKLRDLAMETDSVNMSDAQMEAVQLGVSSMRLSH